MQSGFTGDDERAILTLLFNSSDAELQVIFNPKNGIDPKDLDSDFQGPEEGELRGFYDRKFEGGRAAALKGSRTLLTETAEEKEKPPGDILRSLSFKSDHGVLQDNNSDWSAGVPDGEPEWFVSGDNKVVSKPISQTMGTPITAEATLNLLPATAAAAPITLRSESLDPYLQFRFSGTMQGGTGQTIFLSSVGNSRLKLRHFETAGFDGT